MNRQDETTGEQAGSKVLLECGHRLSIPFGLSPEVAAAELLHHRAVCESSPSAPILPGLLFPLPAWRAFPEVSR